MNIKEMIEDYCRRSKSPYAPQEVAMVALNNLVFTNGEGFAVVAHVLNELHVLFAYAAPGKSFKPIRDKIEETARNHGIKRIKFSTDRPEAFGRLFRGYKPYATILVKEVT